MEYIFDREPEEQVNSERENYAYVTVVTNERYLDGCYVLNESLKRANSKYPFYVLVPTTINSEIMQRLKSKQINYLLVDYSQQQDIRFQNNERGYWAETVFKLEIYGMVQFDKIVFLDADMIVLKNIDCLFSKPHMSAVIAGKSLHPNWVSLNSGLMVVIPNLTDYAGLQMCISDAYRTRRAMGFGFGDQDVIKAFFRSWPLTSSLHLEEKYNVMLGYAGAMKRAKLIQTEDDIFAYHFTGQQKPWSNNLVDKIAIVLKIIKRKGCFIDFKILSYYRKILHEVRNLEIIKNSAEI